MNIPLAQRKSNSLLSCGLLVQVQQGIPSSPQIDEIEKYMNEESPSDPGAAPWLAGIHQAVDGFYYYEPPGHGSYAAHTMREIAAKLDEMNKSWSDQIDRELNPANAIAQTPPDDGTKIIPVVTDDILDAIEKEVGMGSGAWDCVPPKETMKEAKIKLTLKPCGDCWLHIDAPSGLRASINLGQRGSMNDNIIVGRTIRITKNSQFQANTFTTEDVCQRCMKSLASIIADGIESLDRWIELSDEEKEETRIFG